MSDPTLATENELDREDSNRERARACLKRAQDGSERADQYVTVALSVNFSLLLARGGMGLAGQTTRAHTCIIYMYLTHIEWIVV